MKKRLLSVGLAVGALLLAASPVFASWSVDKQVGTIGQFDYSKWPGVVCKYNNSSALMTSITVRAPKMWGTHASATVVGWRFQVREAIPFQGGRIIFRSPVYKGMASSAVPSTFTAHTWRLSHDVSSSSRYYVQYKMFWYAPGSNGTVEGKFVGTPDWFSRKFGALSAMSVSGCDYGDWQWAAQS